MAMSSGAGGDAGPRGRRRRVSAERVHSRTAQNEISVVLEAVVVVFGVRDSRICELFCRAAAA